MEELYVSIDIEADGKIPARNSMMSFGAAAYTLDKELLTTFSANLKPYPGAIPDVDTMRFWAQNPVAYQASTCDQQDPAQALKDFDTWLSKLRDMRSGWTYKPVMVAYPGGYDFQWVNWYLNYYVGFNRMGWSVFCLKSYVAAHLKIDYNKSVKKRMPKYWFDQFPHTHIAIDDAIEQGALAINVMREVRGLTPIKGIIDKRNPNVV